MIREELKPEINQDYIRLLNIFDKFLKKGQLAVETINNIEAEFQKYANGEQKENLTLVRIKNHILTFFVKERK